MNRLLRILATVITLPLPVLAQGATIAPHIVVIDDRERAATVTLYNPGARPIEVTTGMVFGAVVTDSAGEFTVVYDADSSGRSAAGWLATYPRRFVLAPLARQTVRIMARPPLGLADGEYWARMTIATRNGATVMTASDSTGIHVGLGLEVRTILPVYYRKGVMSTGVAIAEPRVSHEGDSLVIRLPLTRTGVAAYIGNVRATLVDAAGRVAQEVLCAVAVFRDANPRIAMSIRGIPAGNYRLRIEAVTERAGVEPAMLVRAPAIRTEFGVVL
jgi:hypothetical protein